MAEMTRSNVCIEIIDAEKPANWSLEGGTCRQALGFATRLAVGSRHCTVLAAQGRHTRAVHFSDRMTFGCRVSSTPAISADSPCNPVKPTPQGFNMISTLV